MTDTMPYPVPHCPRCVSVHRSAERFTVLKPAVTPQVGHTFGSVLWRRGTEVQLVAEPVTRTDGLQHYAFKHPEANALALACVSVERGRFGPLEQTGARPDRRRL